jgi:predicted NBD/HSP70 family sugar kinase
MRRGANLPAIGGFNQAVVLDGIRRAPDGLSRVELAETTGLSAQTVTNVTRRLLDRGLIREMGKQISGPGKPRTILALEPGGGYAVGVHLDPSYITYVLVDLEGRVVGHARARTPTARRPSAVLDAMERSIEALIADSGLDRSTVLGLGIAAPGPIDREAGIVQHPPLLGGWKNVALRSELGARIGLPVALEKDTIASAIGEQWAAGDGEREDFAFVYFGTGIGLGMVLDGEPGHGASSNAGDIGHLMVRGDGELCSCGRIGCLGQNTSPATLVRWARERGVLPEADGPVTEGGLDRVAVDEAFTALADLARAGDAGAIELLSTAMQDLAEAVIQITNLLDVERVVGGGPFWERLTAPGLHVMQAAIDASPRHVAPHPVRVADTRLGGDVAAVGGACLVLDSVFSARPSALVLTVAG